jgi:hypothetical protein
MEQMPVVTVSTMSLDESEMLAELETNIGNDKSVKRDLLNRKLAFMRKIGIKVKPGDLLTQYFDDIHTRNDDVIGEREVTDLISDLLNASEDFMRTSYWLADTKVSLVDLIAFDVAHATGKINEAFIEDETDEIVPRKNDCSTCESRDLCKSFFRLG